MTTDTEAKNSASVALFTLQQTERKLGQYLSFNASFPRAINHLNWAIRELESYLYPKDDNAPD